MSRRFQFSLARLMGAMTIFAFAALFGRDFVPFSFVIAGCAIGIIAGRPGYGLWAGFFLWVFLMG